MDSAISQQMLRGDALQLALGVLVLASGLAACLLFIPRATRRDFTLLFFGLAAGMYGARLLITTDTLPKLLPDLAPTFTVMNWVITGLVLVPLGLFFAEIVTPRWKKLVWWAVAVEFIEGLTYVAAHFLDRGVKLTNTINSIMVLLTLPAMLLFFISVKKASQEMWVLRIGFAVFLGFVGLRQPGYARVDQWYCLDRIPGICISTLLSWLRSRGTIGAERRTAGGHQQGNGNRAPDPGGTVA